MSKHLDTGSIIQRETPQILREGRKRMRGGQPGNQNAVTHGRFSAPVRAARRAAAAQRQTASDEWRAKIPTWDWHATCAEIERNAAGNRPGTDRVIR
jgi:hypothetical protein